MRICFISYEYPPDTGIGGIATYILQITSLFSKKGVDVEVICGSKNRSGTEVISDSYTITRIRCLNQEAFNTLFSKVVRDRHRLKPFDLAEIPEYGAGALFIEQEIKEIPLIVKLHTPRFLIKQINDFYYDQKPLRKLMNFFKGSYQKEKDPEYQSTLKADHIISPSVSLKEIVSSTWNIPAEKIIHAPSPYQPNENFFSIDINGSSQTILYIGRLETRKGVWNLAKAIPLVLKNNPDAKFIFVGKDSKGPHREKSMKKLMLSEIGDFEENVTFIDHVQITEIPGYLSKAGICVFPSIWENFPNVCLEAMAAGRGIIASQNGGMRDMLEDNQAGLLVDPHNVDIIAESIIHLLQHSMERIQMAKAGRNKVKDYYNDRLVNELISLYESFIKK